MQIPWLYYVNLLGLPFLFGYLTACNFTHTFKPKVSTYGWTMFYVLLDGFILGFQTFFGVKRIYLADTFEYSIIGIAVSFAAMIVIFIMAKGFLSAFMPHWEKRSELAFRANVPEEKKHKKARTIIWRIIFFLLYTLLIVVFYVLRWYEQTFNVDFDALLYTIAAPVKGTGDEIIDTAVLKIVPPIFVMLLLYWASVLSGFGKTESGKVLVFGKNEKGKIITVNTVKVINRIVSFVLLVFFVATAVVLLKLPAYIKSISQMSTIYEEYYVEPDSVKLATEDGSKRNLILIILESMETTYASTEDGGRNTVNYIPKLTALANDEANVSFSDSDKLGGFMSCTGAGWTMGATIATSSGVPFSFPVGQNSMGRYESIAGGLTTLGDILKEQGYNLEAVFGSDASFAGTADYYEQHGGYKVFDLDDYYANNYVEEDFFEWWGVRDEIEYIALKDEITKLASSEEPFAVTMFTMDVHAPGGYVCSRCGNEYSQQLGNVLKCTDEQIDEFVEWCKTQEWYDNTTIFITGDHPRMDKRLIDGLEPDDRRVYNCIVNSAKEAEGATKNRVFTTLDIFPTIISAMGYNIPGNMLGLGTDMLSGQQTLAEQYGLDWLNEQLAMKSNYYMTHFY